MSIKGGREVDEALQECEAALEKLLERQVEEGESFENYEQAVTKIVHEIARRRLEKKLQSIALASLIEWPSSTTRTGVGGATRRWRATDATAQARSCITAYSVHYTCTDTDTASVARR